MVSYLFGPGLLAVIVSFGYAGLWSLRSSYSSSTVVYFGKTRAFGEDSHAFFWYTRTDDDPEGLFLYPHLRHHTRVSQDQEQR